MRRFLAIVLMLLMPLQALQAAGLVVCEPVAQAAPHAHAEAPAHAHHHEGHGAMATEASPDPAQDASAGSDRQPSVDLHPCCHVTASLPAQHASLSLAAPAQLAPMLSALPALSHETSGPFRPPRRLPA